MRWKVIYSLRRSLWLYQENHQKNNNKQCLKEHVVVNISIMMRCALIKRPLHDHSFFSPICTYLTLLYTIEIYKYYKIFFFFFNHEQALACYLIPTSSISALVIKSVHCRIEMVLATLCRCMCKKTTTTWTFLAIYTVYLVEIQYCSNWLCDNEVKIKIDWAESELRTV